MYSRTTALGWAAVNGETDIVKLLLDYPGINVNADYNGKTPLMEANENFKIDVVRNLLNHPNIAIDVPAMGGYLGMAKMLFSYDKENMTIEEKLLIAAIDGDLSEVQNILSSHGQDVDVNRSFGPRS